MSDQEKETKSEKKGVSCITIGCGGCLFLVIGILVLVVVVATKPSIVAHRVFDFLNDDAEIREVDETVNSYQIIADIYSNFSNSTSEQTVTLTEEQLTVLARDTYDELKDITLDVEEDTLWVYWVIRTVDDSRLYGAVEITRNNEQHEITHFGTKRIGFPKLINEIITSKTKDMVDQGKEDESVDDFILKLINSNGKFSLEDITYENDFVNLTLKAK